VEGGVPQLGASHEANAGFGEARGGARDLGPGDVAQMFGSATTPLERLREKGMVDESNLEERGGGGEVPEIRVPLHIKTLAVTPENFPDADPKFLAKLKRKYPDGIPPIMGGQGDSQEMMMNLLNAFQSEKPFEVTLTSARMRAVETSLALRYGSAAKASELLEDKRMLFRGLVDRQGKLVPITMTRLATLHQIVTTSPVAQPLKGVLIEERDGKAVIVNPNFDSPPQLVREFKVNDFDHGDHFVLSPFVPEKLELFVKAFQQQELGGPRTYTYKEIEASRRQVSNYFAMLNLTRGLAGSLSQHDMLELQRTADRIMAGSHDETPVFKLIAMVPQVHAMLASDKIETLAQFYETHLTETRIFHAMRTTALAVGMQVRSPSGNTVEVSGTLALGDFMDQLLSSQRQLEQVMQNTTDSGSRMGIRGLVSPHPNPTNEGTVAEEGKLIWQVLADRLGALDQQGHWMSLKTLLFGGKDPAEMKWEELANCTKDSVLRTNIPDVEVMLPLTKESLGVYPIEENIPAALYPLYLSAREFSRGLLLDLMMTPDFQGKSGKQVRKLKRWNYDVWTYWQGRVGLNELQKTFPYKDFISEKLIPAFIEKTKIEEVPNWKNLLRGEVARGEWLDAFDKYQSYTELAKDVIATVFTNPTLLPSRMPDVEGYITALALNTPSTSRVQKVEVYKKYLQDEFISKGQMGSDEFTHRVDEFNHLLDYWVGGGPVRTQYEADMASGSIPRGFSLEQWLKHRIANERYASRSQRSGTLRTKEEMRAAYVTLTEAEKAVLDLSVDGRRLVKFVGTPDKPGIIDSMGIGFINTEGLAGLGELVEKFHWRNFPINAIPPRLVDGTSVGGYLADFVNLTNDTAKLMDGIGERKVQEKVTALPTTAENIDTGQMIGLAEKAADYILSTFHFVPFPHQRERAVEALKILLWATTPLKSNELVVATIRAIPKGTGKPTIQEMFIPVNLFGEREQTWLKGNSMRGHKKGGKEGMIFLSDYPARLRLRFGDVKNGIFSDMRNAAKECRQSLTIVGMERPNYNTIPWKKTLITLARKLRQGSMLTENDMQELNRFAEKHFDPAHRDVSETGSQRADRGLQDLLEIVQAPLDLLSSLLGGGK